ncbi:MAG: YIP1 family protein [Chloroflexales bacterium]
MAHDELTGRGIAALRAGDRAGAQALLAAAVRANPDDAQAWLWLSGAVADPAAQRVCLERALSLDPACAPARRGLAALQADAVHHEAHEAHEGRTFQPDLPTLRGTNLPAPQETTPEDPTERPDLRVLRALRGTNLRRPLYTIWRHPRAALRAALARQAPFTHWLLAALAGVSASLAWAAWAKLGSQLGAGELLTVAVSAGFALGTLALLLSGVLLRTGGWLIGGQASAGQVRVALAWSMLPVVAGLPLWLAQLALLPTASFGAAPDPAQGLLAGVCGGAHAALWLWSAALSVIGLAEAHQITVARAAASWLLAALVVAGAVGAMLELVALIISLRGG